ncbi:hypothetical protein L3Y34_008699 [Caenorhabditis briggsae]|uniref:Uncharacterized protein n=1 Tax=Caenorhabditis briggsae TaxID=6238 RepID=A0AAE9A3E0_CAEBR|nr:hypothetical protein L3Y34_008699 [Caenorhabditis briggsae]
MEKLIEDVEKGFEILSPSDIQLQMNSKIEEIQSKILISTGYCRVLIQKETGDIEDFLRKFLKTMAAVTIIEDGECGL